jgi:hypothetical protein
MATSRQLAQRARRDREHPHRRSMTQPTNRELAQRARQCREHLLSNHGCELQEERLPIARRPPSATLRHELGHCDVLCSFCGAEHWIEERVQGSTLTAPKFSTCCTGGAVMMDKFEDPPEPLYSLLRDSTPGIFCVGIFTDHEHPRDFVTTSGTITMHSLSALLVSKEICQFMGLRGYTLFAFKVNCVISSDLSFRHLEKSRHSLRSIYTIPIPHVKHNNECHTILICSMSISCCLFKRCFNDIIPISRCF